MPGRESGFTLVELLVSILLIGLVLGALGAGLSTIARGWDRHGANLANQDMLLRAQSQFQRDIAGLQRAVWAEGDRAGRTADDADQDRAPRFIFSGEATRLRFLAVEPPRPARPGPYLISYAASGGGGLLRARARFHPDVRDLDTPDYGDPVELITGPYRYAFSYGERLPAAEAWRWHATWQQAEALPDLIRLEVRHRRTGALVVTPLLARPRIDAEQACAGSQRASAGCTIAVGAARSDTDATAEREVGDAAR